MNRSLLIGILATIILFSGIAVFFYLNNIKVKGRGATEAIPNDAFLVFQSRNILSSWKTLNESALWKDLAANAAVTGLNSRAENIGNLVRENEDLQELLSGNTTVVSFHHTLEKLAMLAVTETGGKMEAADYAGYVASHVKGKVTRRSFEKIPVYDVSDAEGNYLLSMAFYDQLLMCSGESSLVEDALRKLKYKLPNLTKGFEQVQLLADQGADLNLFINYQRLSKFFTLFTKREYAPLFDFFKAFANWSMLDVKLGKDQLGITGITYTDDSVFQFLDLFKNQTPKALTLQAMMPANTTFAFQMGFTDYMKFNSELGEYLQVHKKGGLYTRFADSIENRYDIDISQRVLPFIDGEASLAMIQPTGSDYKSNLAAFIRFKDPGSMMASLKGFVQAMDKKGEADSVTIYHEGVELERIKLGNFLKLYYGEVMENISSPYFALLDDVVVFANEAGTLRHIISQYRQGATLANDERYKAYAATLAQNNNVNIFMSPSGNFALPADFVTDEFFSTLNTHQFTFKKFTFLNIQFANTNNKAFYTHVQYQYASGDSAGTRQLWASALDTTFAVPPQVVYNTRLKQQVIFVQDVKNTLYCLGTNGSLIWKSKLNGRLMGKFHAMDVRKNGTLCYLFGTERQANLIDEEGVSLPGYPINYPGKAVQPFTLAASEADTTASYFIPLENNRIMGYRLSGKPLAGWNPKVLESRPASEVGIGRQGSRTLVYVTDVKGKLWIFGEKGQRIKTGFDPVAAWHRLLPSADTTQLVFRYADTSGRVMQITFDSAYRLADTAEAGRLMPSGKVIMQTDPVTSKLYFLLQQGSAWALYDDAFKRLLGEGPEGDTIPLLYFTSDATGRVMLARVDRKKGEYAWFDMSGKQHQDFPVKGYSAFTTGDVMLDRANYLIGGDDRNNIFLYRFR